MRVNNFAKVCNGKKVAILCGYFVRECKWLFCEKGKLCKKFLRVKKRKFGFMYKMSKFVLEGLKVVLKF